MSYILEALRQAERERRTAEDPVADLTFDAPVTAADSRRMVLVGAVLLLNVLALLALWLFWGREPAAPVALNAAPPIASEMSVAPAPPEVMRDTETAKPMDPPVAAREVTSAEPPVEVREAVGAAPQVAPAPAVKVSPSIPSLVARAVSRPLSEEAGVAAPRVAEVAPKADPPKASPIVARAEPPSPVPALPRNEPRSEPAVVPEPMPPEEEITDEQGARIPFLAELPDEVRRRLPELRVKVHVYGEEPARRFVLMGLRRYHEGERIGLDGPVIERITPDGMVIDYGQGLARIAVSH